MKVAATFSAITFAPVLIAFLLTALFLMPMGMIFTLIALFDPSVTLSSAILYDLWIIGPFMAMIGLFGIGTGLYYLHQHIRSPFVAWSAIWFVFSTTFFLAIWIGVIIVTSIGASETPPLVFLRITVTIASVLILLGQALVIPWLVCASKLLPGLEKFANSSKGRKSIENE